MICLIKMKDNVAIKIQLIVQMKNFQDFVKMKKALKVAIYSLPQIFFINQYVQILKCAIDG